MKTSATIRLWLDSAISRFCSNRSRSVAKNCRSVIDESARGDVLNPRRSPLALRLNLSSEGNERSR